MIQTEQTVITPHGQFVAMWDEDENIPVAYRGDAAALAFFNAYLDQRLVTGRNGLRLAFRNLEPADLVGFCQSREYGITVLEDPADFIANMALEGEADE